MAFMYIKEFGGTGISRADIAQGPALAIQKIAIGSEVKSAAFQPGTRIVRLHVDAICSFLVSSPDINGNYAAATTSSARMAADNTEYFGVNPGDKVSVISNT